MSFLKKVERAKTALKEGGIKELSMKTTRYFYSCIRPAKYRWPTKDVVKDDMAQFQRVYGYTFDIYHPSTFSEKVHTYKLLYKDPIMSKIVDKYSFKDYIAQNLPGGGNHVVPAYGVWDNINDLEKAWDSLPKEFVLKSTISSDGNNMLFIKDKSAVKFSKIRSAVSKWFNPKFTQLNGYSLAYYSLKSRVLAEKYMHELDGSDNLRDYKFYCFNGDVRFVYTTSRTFESNDNPSEADYPRTFFDLNWNKINVALGSHPTSENEERPLHLEKMIEISKILSTGFPFVRIDFYDLPENPLLGEMTFYPTGGMKPLKPDEFDKKMGELFIIPEDKLLKLD